MPDLVGKQLKDYRVLRRLGRGAMAEVYLAQQLSLGRQVAFKVLDEKLARDPSYVKRFEHEARAAAALVHAQIVQIYEVGYEKVHGKGVHFIAQEYVAGRNLGQVLRAQGRLGPPFVLDVLRQVAAALAKAASEGIVHRDIKPENILLARSGELKVADFGLARVEGAVNMTQVGVTMGTPLYMSPEQVEGGAIDSRSDIYSLGVTAYHMLTGSPPFAGETPLAVAVEHLNTLAKPITQLHPELPESLARVVHRMLAKKRADRYADPAELLRELHTLAQESVAEGWGPSTLRQDDLPSGIWATSQLDALMKTQCLTTPRRGRTRWLAAIVAGGLLLGAGLATLSEPPSLLVDARHGPPERDTVWAQIYHAKTVDTEAAWLAVEAYFPDDLPYYHDLAKQGLVRYYFFRTKEYGKAIGTLKELAASQDGPLFQAFGMAGLVVAYTERGQDRKARDTNGLLTIEMRNQLQQKAPRMARLLQQAMQER